MTMYIVKQANSVKVTGEAKNNRKGYMLDMIDRVAKTLNLKQAIHRVTIGEDGEYIYTIRDPKTKEKLFQEQGMLSGLYDTTGHRKFQ